MSKVIDVNSSLPYEVLLYLNNFYLGMFIVCEVATGILKACNANYPENALWTETAIFIMFCMVEAMRIFLGRRGNLVSQRLPVLLSIILTIPSSVGVCYFLLYQTFILRVEYIWCVIMLVFHVLELTLAFRFIFTVCKSQQSS